ncbi:MAG: S-methyl-5'-thioadenosine phosphorylase [Candidatus Woesearchaeota archaeon]|jgi:5'-methylthioadenosine phosphorylase
MVKIAIIGGSGLDNPDILKDVEELTVDTKYGSVILKEGYIDDVRIYILSRHGKNHETTPSNVNYRANILALKKLGVTHILAATAVGSLKKEIKPGHIVFPAQYIDFTKKRQLTFFDDVVVHTSLADPYCLALRQLASKVARDLKIPHHNNRTLVTIEGPRFSTRAESHMFRKLGADVINMSNVPESQLAREAGMCYLTIAMSTDYDCWKTSEEAVTFEMVLEIMKNNANKVIALIRKMIPLIRDVDCGCSANVHPSILISLAEKSSEDISEDFCSTSKFGKFLNGDTSNKNSSEEIKSFIRTIPNFPKKGIMFRDVTTLFKNKMGLKLSIDALAEIYKDKKIDKFVGIESRGFILASALAYKLNAGVVLARKPNKLPGKKISQEYSLEYGKDKLEMHTDAISKGENIVIIDDLIATGGTAKATGKLVEKLGGKIDSFAFVVDLPDLGGKEKLKPHKVYTIVEFEGD